MQKTKTRVCQSVTLQTKFLDRKATLIMILDSSLLPPLFLIFADTFVSVRISYKPMSLL